MDQAVSTYITELRVSHRAAYAGFRRALSLAREAIERRGAEWYVIYVKPGGSLSSRTPAALRALTDLANSGEREDNMDDPRIRKHVEASRRRYASRRAAMIARPGW